MKVDGKTGERAVRYGATTAKALKQYLKLRSRVNGHNDSLWPMRKGVTLKDSSVETLFIKLIEEGMLGYREERRLTLVGAKMYKIGPEG